MLHFWPRGAFGSSWLVVTVSCILSRPPASSGCFCHGKHSTLGLLCTPYVLCYLSSPLLLRGNCTAQRDMGRVEVETGQRSEWSALSFCLSTPYFPLFILFAQKWIKMQIKIRVSYCLIYKLPGIEPLAAGAAAVVLGIRSFQFGELSKGGSFLFIECRKFRVCSCAGCVSCLAL